MCNPATAASNCLARLIVDRGNQVAFVAHECLQGVRCQFVGVHGSEPAAPPVTSFLKEPAPAGKGWATGPHRGELARAVARKRGRRGNGDELFASNGESPSRRAEDP
jgi:hypothetical protein